MTTVRYTIKNMSTKKTTSNAAAELGRRGGKAVAKKHGKGYMKALGKKGADKRWADNKNADTKNTKKSKKV